MARVGALLGLVRWPGVVTAAVNAATGFLLAHDRASPGGWAAAAGAVAGGGLLYAGGVAMNDVADAVRDRTLHPSRPIPSGRVDRIAAARFAAALLAAGVGTVALLAGPEAGAFAAFAAMCAVLYDFTGRRVRIVGATLLGLARASNALAGSLAAAGDLDTLLASRAFPSLAVLHAVGLLAYTAVLVWVSTYEESEGGPGRRLPGFFALSLGVTAAVPWMVFPRVSWAESPGIPLVLLAGTLVVAARDAMEPRTAGSPAPGVGAIVRAGVFGFLLVDSAWLFGAGRYDAGFWALLVFVAMRLALLRARS